MTSEREELRPCPFCGGQVQWVDLNDFGDVRLSCQRMAIRCDRCELTAQFYPSSMFRQKQKWNRRPTVTSELVGWLKCRLGLHDFYARKRLSWCSWKLGCRRCDRLFAINTDVRALIPWDREIEDFYANRFMEGGDDTEK